MNQKLRTIIDNYSDEAPYVLCISTNKLADTEQTLKAAGTLRIWQLYRVIFSQRFNTSPAYCTLTHSLLHQEHL